MRSVDLTDDQGRAGGAWEAFSAYCWGIRLAESCGSESLRYPASAVDGRSHVEALSSALAAFGKAVRKAVDETDELGDQDSSDIFTEISRGIDKWLWFVEAHLQAER